MKYIFYVYLLPVFVYTQTLDTLIQRGIKHNPLLHAFDAKIQSIESQADKVAFLPDPSVEATYFTNEIITANGPQTAQFMLKQTFPWFGSLSAKEASVRASSKIIMEKKKLATLQFIFQIKSNYYKLAAVQKKNRLLSDYISLLNNFYASTLSRYTHGNGMQQDILKVQTELSSIKSRQLGLSSLRAHLSSQLNYLSYTEWDSVRATFPKDSLILKTDLNIQQNHLIKSLYSKKKQLQLLQKYVQKSALPKLSFALKYHLINEKTSVLENKDAFGISIGASLPLWIGKYASEEEQYEQQELETDYIIRDQEKKQTEAIRYLAYAIAEKQERLRIYQTDLIPKAQLTLKSSMNAYETGKQSFLNLLDAQRMLLNLQLEEISIQESLYLTYSEYQKETSSL